MKYQVIEKNGQKHITPIRYSIRNDQQQEQVKKSETMNESFHTQAILAGEVQQKDSSNME